MTTPNKITLFFSAIVACLILVHVAGVYSTFYLGHDYVHGLIPLFDLGAENNIPSIYSAASILFCSILLFIIGFDKKKSGDADSFHWLALAAIFLFLFADDLLSIHEHISLLLQSRLHTSGLLYFAWVIPYGIGLAVFAASFIGFLMRLPARFRILFVLAGFVSIMGAMGLESLGGRWCELYGCQNITYAELVTTEESLEMIGIVVFIRALVSYIYLRLSEGGS